MARGTDVHNMMGRDEEEFGHQDEWGEEEFDERVSHNSSRMNDSSYVPNNQMENNQDNNDQNYGYSNDNNYNDYQGYGNEHQDQSNGEGSEIEQIIEETYEEVGEIHDPESKKDFQSAYEQLVEKVSHDQNHRDLLLSDHEYDNMQRKKGMKNNLKVRNDT